MSHLASLPDEVLKHILHKVPRKQRLSSCSLVSRRFHAAAAAASSELSFDACDSPRAQRTDGVLQWLSLYGQHVTQLELHRFPQPLKQLPCPHLLHLNLEVCRVQLGPTADGHPGILQDCTRLTHLSLVCPIFDAAESTGRDSLSRLVDLRHLSVAPEDEEEFALSRTALAEQKRLTHLNVRLTADSLPHLSALSSLRELKLCVEEGMADAPSVVPSCVLPACLTRLELWSPVEASMLSVVPTGLQVLKVMCGTQGPAEGPGSVLFGMARLLHLTELVLPRVRVEWPAPGPAYSALTASSGLVSMYLSVPGGAWPFMWPSGRTLPHLTRLLIYEAAEPYPWAPADMSRLVTCCPHLQMIAPMHLSAGRHVSALRKLTALTELMLHLDDAGDARAAWESLQGLAAATQLRELRCGLSSPHWKVPWLLYLTSLTALKSLRVHEAASLESIVHYYCFKPPDVPVWLQLLVRCAAEPGSREAALHSLAKQVPGPKGATVLKALTLNLQRQLGKQQQQIGQQGQLIADLNALLSVQQQTIALQAEQVAGQAAHMAEQHARIAEQEGRIADLEGHMAAQEQVVQQQAASIAGLQAQLQELLQRLPPRDVSACEPQSACGESS